MGLFAYFSGPTSPAEAQVQPQTALSVEANSIEKAKDPAHDEQPTPDTGPHSAITETSPPPKLKTRRSLITTFTKPSASHKEHANTHKAILTGAQEHEKEANAVAALSKRIAFSRKSRSEKRAKESALMVRSIIAGPSASSPAVTTTVAKPRMSKLKSDLSKPKTANKVIAQLRTLPFTDHTDSRPKELISSSKSSAPIHAVCLEHPDKKAHELHFAQLTSGEGDVAEHKPAEQFSALISEMRVVDFFKADFGLGQPGDGEGILAGAVPTAATIIKGIETITPELMALGYATGRSIVPDHQGIHPPVDRMSVLTYWWGLELVLPPPSIAYLGSVKSISNTVVNFLSAIALVNSGASELVPFIRYISQFIEFEFNAIKGQDKGNGVVCAATWIMPAALVPRSWDFPTPPQAPSEEPVPNSGADVQPDGSTTTVPSVPPSDNPPSKSPDVTKPSAKDPPSAGVQPDGSTTTVPSVPPSDNPPSKSPKSPDVTNPSAKDPPSADVQPDGSTTTVPSVPPNDNPPSKSPKVTNPSAKDPPSAD